MSEPLARRRVGDLEIAYRQVGEGPPLILFHGAEGDHQIYDRLQDALAGSVMSISFDQRDCGLTTYAEPTPYTLKDVASDAVGLLDALGYRFAHVLGNSVGGVLAQLMACHWPDRVGRLILGLTWPADERLADLNPEGLRRRAAYAAQGSAGERAMAELMSSPDYVETHPQIVEEMRSLRTETPAAARERRFAAFATPPVVDLSSIRHQTLVIGGEHDQMVPPIVSVRLSTRLAHARYEVLEGVGHLAARQAPDRLAELVASFITSDC